MKLRDYQKAAIRGVYDEMRAKRTRVVLVVPTGGGKTCIATEVVRQGVERGRRILWVVHRRELVDQAAATLAAAGLDVGAICATAAWPVKADAPVQVASVQTLVAREGIRPAADLLVWDECHHAAEAAEQWVSVLKDYPDAPLLGLTATPERGDGTGLAPLFTGIVQGVSTRQLTEQGNLVPCRVIRPDRWLKSKRQSGNPLAQDPVDAWNEHCAGRQGFIFAATVEEAEGYAKRLDGAFAISAKTPPEIRAAALQGFREGKVRVLVNVYVFTEGTDLPMASACVLGRNASTPGMMLQMTGRVLRTCGGKSDAVLVDLPGITHVWGMPEDERMWRLEGKACVVLGQKCAVCKAPIEEYPCPQCGYVPEVSEREQSQTEILNERLAEFARKIAQGPEQRKETVRRWMAECAYKDRAPGSVMFRFERLYNVKLTTNEYFRALGDLTHDSSTTVSEWAKKHLKRISDGRRSRRSASSPA